MEAAFYLYHRYVCCYSNPLPLSLAISSFSKDGSADRGDIDHSDIIFMVMILMARVSRAVTDAE